MLTNLGLWQDGYEGLFKLACAVSMARRLATKTAAGYLRRIIERGLWGKGLYGPALQDEQAAKRMLKELDL
jgi:hypothetical protein